MQLMLKDNKFKGDLSQSIQTSLKPYQICCRQYSLSQAQKADFLVHAFDGPARTFFFNNTLETMMFQERCAVMLKEYNSDARQLQVKGKIDNLRLKTFMEEKDISEVSEGLSQLVELVEELTPQCHPDFRPDPHKISYLRKAVADFKSWSHNPIQSITSRGYSSMDL